MVSSPVFVTMIFSMCLVLQTGSLANAHRLTSIGFGSVHDRNHKVPIFDSYFLNASLLSMACDVRTSNVAVPFFHADDFKRLNPSRSLAWSPCRLSGPINADIDSSNLACSIVPLPSHQGLVQFNEFFWWNVIEATAKHVNNTRNSQSIRFRLPSYYIVVIDRLDSGTEDDVFSFGLSDVIHRVNAVAQMDWFHVCQWRQIRSDNLWVDGIYLETNLAMSSPEHNVDCDEGLRCEPKVVSEVECKGFETDSYWDYYRDIDRWGIVLRADLRRVSAPVANYQALDGQRVASKRGGSTVPNERSETVDDQEPMPTTIIFSISYARATERSSSSQFGNVRAMLGQSVLNYVETIQARTAAILELLFKLTEIENAIPKVKPLLDNMQFNAAHHMILNTHDCEYSAITTHLNENPINLNEQSTLLITTPNRPTAANLIDATMNCVEQKIEMQIERMIDGFSRRRGN